MKININEYPKSYYDHNYVKGVIFSVSLFIFILSLMSIQFLLLSIFAIPIGIWYFNKSLKCKEFLEISKTRFDMYDTSAGIRKGYKQIDNLVIRDVKSIEEIQYLALRKTCELEADAIVIDYNSSSITTSKWERKDVLSPKKLKIDTETLYSGVAYIIKYIDDEDIKPEVINNNENNNIEKLEKLAKLKNDGVLTEEEFQAEKRKILF